MTEQQASAAETPQPPAALANRKRGKLVFLALAAAAVFGVYWLQRKAPVLSNWSTDLDAALITARDEYRSILVVFMKEPPSETVRTWAKIALGKKQNKQAIYEQKILTVKVVMTRSARKKWGERYKITRYPTMLLLGPDGKEKNRREAKAVGELPFVRDFLSCRVVETPKQR